MENKTPNMKDELKEARKKKASKPAFGKGKILILIIILLLGAAFALVNFITDIMWFKELGYLSVFFKKLFTMLKIGIPVFIVVTLLAYIYFKILKQNYFERIESRDEDKSASINKISWGMAIFYGGIMTYVSVKNLWFEGLKFFHSQDVGIDDPIFNLDASFYIFKLDFINNLNSVILGGLVILLVMTLFYYVALMSTRKPQVFEEVDDEKPGADPFAEEDEFAQAGPGAKGGLGANPFNPFEQIFKGFGNLNKGAKGRAPRKEKQLDKDNLNDLLDIGKRQLIIVGVVFFLMVGIHYFLKQFSLLYTHTGAVYGAGYTDVHISLWMYRIMVVLAILSAVGVVVAFSKKSFKAFLIAPVLMILVGLVGNGAGMLVQNFVVSPDEIAKESPYLERNIEYTQYAYNLSQVTKKSFPANNDLTSEDIQNNDATISNIRINDYQPAMTFYNQTQSIRQYYTFQDVDVDRYNVDGEYTQTFLSPREIDEGKISATWINTHLKYTHGYGVTLSRVDKITPSGQPDMLIDGIPPVSEVEDIQITRPEIYYGELTNNYTIVNTKEDEFDYPDGDANKYTQYEGEGGIRLNPINRVLFAIRERSLKLLVSSNITSDSKIMINRNISERVNKIMPYLRYEKDPYMCTVDGKLYWIVDAYTTSNKFPYSEPYSSESNVNYLRNSVKVVVDAYNGDVTFYVCDETDAIANTYASIYPKLFKDFDEMPEGVRAHIRYPNTMFQVQADVYRRYHMNDVKVFYQNEDLWDIANEIYGTKEQPMQPNYYILSMPGEKTEEFVNSIVYTPRDKKNMMGILMARNDGEHYGELVLFQLPKSKLVYGPMQVEAMIDQSPEISKEFSLWNSAGSKYSRGNLFVIPIEESLLYVEPVYLEATNSSIPEVKRVIVVYGDKIAYKPTLSEALNDIFGEATREEEVKPAAGGDGPETLTQDQLIEKAQKAYDNGQDALKEGDWAKYGQYMDELEEVLTQLSK